MLHEENLTFLKEKRDNSIKQEGMQMAGHKGNIREIRHQLPNSITRGHATESSD